ncbi:MAG: DNA polymerase III subunit delta [Desulfovibrionaceae bacterium]
MARPGFTLCVCPDGRLTKDYIHKTLTSPDGTSPPWERFTYWGDEELPPLFWEHLTLQGLFGTPRALTIRNAHSLPAATWKRLSTALARPNAHCWPFFCLEVAWEKGQPKLPAHIAKLPCVHFADKQGWIWRQAGLDERTVRRHVQNRAQALHMSFAAGALDRLCAGLPPDANAVENELQKLSLAAGDGPVSVEMASSAGHVPDFNIFGFIRLIQAGNVAGAWAEVRRGQRDGDGLLFPFLGLLVREARLLWQVHMGEAVRMHPNDAQNKKLLAQRLGQSGIIRLFDAIVRAEWDVKSGQRQPDQTLEALVADLILLFSPQRVS